MPTATADASDREAIRRLASDSTLVRVTKTAQYDMLAHDLTKGELCRVIVDWTDSGEPIKKVTLRGAHTGQPAYEMKPRINNVLFYVKVTPCELEEPDEYLLILSVHPDH